MKNLYEITKKESGIVVYPDFKLICNWLSIDGLPRIFAGSLFGMGENLKLTKKIRATKEELQAFLHDMDPSEISSDGYIYQIETNREIIPVITIDDWH